MITMTKTTGAWAATGLLLLCCLAGPGYAQQVRVQVVPEDVGLGGQVRPGSWAPMRLKVQNQAASPREVICRWTVTDIDGDVVLASRAVTLSPQRTHDVWLYAPLRINARQMRWRVSVDDAESGQVLASVPVRPAVALAPQTGAVGLVGTGPLSLGLEPYVSDYTQHERLRFVSVGPERLPDRWYGLSMVDALVWTRRAGDPGTTPIPTPTLDALRQWVSRGGHLVIVAATVGDGWYASPLRDMLPPAESVLISDVTPPVWLGRPLSVEQLRIEMRVYRPVGDVAVLLEDAQGRPAVIASQYGLGRVTVIGVDLTDPRLVSMRLPNGPTLWNAVFGWRSPAHRKATIEGMLAANPPQMSRPEMRARRYLGQDLLPSRLAMKETASAVMMVAILLFGVYWLLAGPLGFVFLRSRGWSHWSWVGFLVTVLAFSALTWGGALLVRPKTSRMVHLTVLTADMASEQVHMHGWMSLFVPRHEGVTLRLGADSDDDDSPEPGQDTLASIGLRNDAVFGGFQDQRRYVVNAAAPGRLTVPMRATAKQFEFDYLGEAGPDLRARETPWVLPRGELTVENAVPKGRLTHNLPLPLQNVLVVFCPGDGVEPWVWREAIWPVGQPLVIDRLKGQRLAVPPLRADQRAWSGHLGELMKRRPGQGFGQFQGGPTAATSPDEVVDLVELLTFFETLPPPDYRSLDMGSRATNYRRTIGRDLDLTPLLAMRRLIVIGYLRDGPTPLPLTVDGGEPPARGWTIVRCVYRLPQ